MMNESAQLRQMAEMPRCRTCGHWQEGGKCSRLSGTVLDGECFPTPRGDALIIAWPVCVHDGAAVEFETDSDFGCVHHTDLVGA